MMELRIEPSAQQHNNSILYEACVQAIEQAWHLPVVERGVVDTELVHRRSLRQRRRDAGVGRGADEERCGELGPNLGGYLRTTFGDQYEGRP